MIEHAFLRPILLTNPHFFNSALRNIFDRARPLKFSSSLHLQLAIIAERQLYCSLLTAFRRAKRYTRQTELELLETQIRR